MLTAILIIVSLILLLMVLDWAIWMQKWLNTRRRK